MLRGDFAGKNKVVVTVKKPPTDDDEASLQLESSYVPPEEPADQPQAVGAHTDET